MAQLSVNDNTRCEYKYQYEKAEMGNSVFMDDMRLQVNQTFIPGDQRV